MTVPSSSYTMTHSSSTEGSDDHIEKLLSVFKDHVTEEQLLAVYDASGKNFEISMECLSQGPTLNSIVAMLNERMKIAERSKIDVDADDIWQDMIVFYKSPTFDSTRQLRIRLGNIPAIDTGGVRRQIFTSIFNQFVNNTHVRLFTGEAHSVRPLCTAYLKMEQHFLRWNRISVLLPTLLLVYGTR